MTNEIRIMKDTIDGLFIQMSHTPKTDKKRRYELSQDIARAKTKLDFYNRKAGIKPKNTVKKHYSVY